MKHCLPWASLLMETIVRDYSDDNGMLDIETVEVDGKNVTVITIQADLIRDWYEEGLDQVVIHIEDEQSNKFF